MSAKQIILDLLKEGEDRIAKSKQREKDITNKFTKTKKELLAIL